MTFLFGGSKMPAMQSVQAPSVSKESQASITEEETKKIRAGRTSRPTLLTGYQGITDQAPVQRKTLLGE